MVRLREASKADGESMLAVHREAVRSVSTDRYTDEEVLAWAGAQDDPDQYPLGEGTQYLYVAEAGDRVVGFVGLDLSSGVLETLYVHPDVQGDGVGTKLLRHAEDTAREDGLRSLTLAASLNAVPYYRDQGYRRRDESYTLEMGNETLEFVRMEKSLG